MGSRLDDVLDTQATALNAIAPDLVPIADAARELLSGGKRFRALFCYWGWQSVASIATDELSPDADDRPGADAVITAAAALELFHAAALVHDDLIDNSDVRRGQPAAHRRFASVHRDAAWNGSSADFGGAAAILLGDLLLTWSDELFGDALEQLDDRRASHAARKEFALMRADVTAGQYLDVLEEASWQTRPQAERLPRAHRVILYKSAKYTVEAPLVIGGSIAGGSLAQLDALRAFGRPLGVAFQLRDDLLGVYGDPEVTGKPAGDDLIEGKRTVLVELARQKLPANAVRLVDELLGDPDLDASQISMLRSTIRDSGAVDQVERIIAHQVQVARDVLIDAPLGRGAREELRTLADTVTRRIA